MGTRAEGCRNWKRINEGADTSVESKYYVRLDSYTCSFLLAGVRVADGAVAAPFERRGKSMMFFRPVPRIVASFFLLFLPLRSSDIWRLSAELETRRVEGGRSVASATVASNAIRK